jgi:predicted CoA-binding protein
MDSYADNEVISGLLTGTSTWAVVGLSTNTSRAAYGVSALLARLGYRIVPVHPRAETVHGQPGYRTLAEIPFPVDVVDMFVNSGRVGAVVDDAIEAGAKAVWLQLGVIDKAAAARAAGSGLEVVMDRCPAIELRRLGLTGPAS